MSSWCLYKTVERGQAGINLNSQTRFLSGSSKWVDEKDENGNPITVLQGEKGVLGLPLATDRNVLKDANGLVLSTSEAIRTTYDMIFGSTQFDACPALGRCTRQHTFKDALLKDGRPNPKPTVVDVPAEWQFLSYAETKRDARAFGLCLRQKYNIGLKEKVAIWSANCAEWLLADLACAAYNWTSVSVYDTLGPNAASYIIADSGAKVVVCEDKTFKLVPALLKDDIYASNPGRDLQVVVCLGKGDADTKQLLEQNGVKVLMFKEAVAEFLAQIDADGKADTPPSTDDIVTIMYTSGTTGMPKGVMLTHGNVVSTVSMMLLTPSMKLSHEDVHLSYLPLAHIFERQNCIALLAKGASLYFASAGSKFLLADLSVVRPTLFAGVPKVYENVRDAVVRKMTGIKKRLFDKAMKSKIADLETGCGYCVLWDKLIFNKTKLALGGRVRFCITGGAPISKDTLQFVLCALGPVIQGYGATETSAASTVTMMFDIEVGHVGPPLGSVAIKLVDVPEMNYFNATVDQYKDAKHQTIFQAGKNKSGGEVWIGGPGVSPGYYDSSLHGLKNGLPSNGMSSKTKDDFFQEDGWSWFKTGDIGSWTDRGCLKIVDRRKNMFKTSLGEYIPVEEVEKTYQDTCPYVDFVFLPKETKVAYVGLCVVVSESIGTVMRWAKENGVEGDDHKVVESDKFKKLLFDEFNAAATSKKLQRFMHIQNVKNIHVEYQPPGYAEHWVAGVQCANGHVEQLLTATFKARRTQLDQYFAPHFAAMYPDRPADHILP